MSGTDILQRILADRAAGVARRRQEQPAGVLRARAAEMEPPRGFLRALAARRGRGPAIIAEIKKASPSHGLIRADFAPGEIAATLAGNGACCLSVLTETKYFQGSDSHLLEVRRATTLPVLRKDFIIDPWQVLESRVLGADCILVIVAALSDSLMAEIHAAADGLGLDCLVEVHNRQELERALRCLPVRLLGVNNRNLSTLVTDTGTSVALAPALPFHVVKISESGIGSAATMARLHALGYDGFLVGESLMRRKDTGAALRMLAGEGT